MRVLNRQDRILVVATAYEARIFLLLEEGKVRLKLKSTEYFKLTNNIQINNVLIN